MKKPAFKSLQMRLLVHYYGVLPAGIFYLFNPLNPSLDHIKNWHNRLVTIADFLEEYFFAIVVVTTLSIFFGTVVYMFFLFFPEGIKGQSFQHAWSLFEGTVSSIFSKPQACDSPSC